MMKTKKDKAPRNHQVKGRTQRKGLVLVHTGPGKGKSTAAFGTALRAIGRGMRVAMVQFIKGKWKTGEEQAARQFLKRRFEIFSMGQGFTWETKNFKQDVQAARKAWQRCKAILHDQKHELVIFDEINYVLQYNFLDVREVIAELKKRPARKHVVLTGNGAPKKLIEFADLVTEMKCVKHPYDQGLKAQPGIEY